MLSRISVSHRIQLLVVLAAFTAGLLGVAGYLALSRASDVANRQMAKRVHLNQENRLKLLLDGLATTVGEELTHLDASTDKDAVIRRMLKPLRFEDDGSGYIFAYRGTINVVHPKKTPGEDFGDDTDVNGFKFVREMSKVAPESGFVQYVTEKPGEGKQPKISYVRMIPGTDVWIGTGVYLDNVASLQAANEAELKAVAFRVQWIATGVGAIMVFGCLIPMGLLISRNIRKQLASASSVIGSSSHKVASASSFIAHASNNLSSGACEQAASIEETSASLEEIAAMASGNAEHTQECNRLMAETMGAVESASSRLAKLTDTIHSIEASNKETQKIVQTIDQIAFQTNILALNAAVEAARAGEAGAGFAVVADEVRALATKSAEAARNTSTLIESGVGRISDGTTLVEDCNEVFEELKNKSAHVAQLLKGIADASAQQSTGVGQVSTAVQQMDTVVQQNAASAEETSSSAEELSNLAAELLETVKNLNGVIHGQSKAASATESVRHSDHVSKGAPSRVSVGSSPTQSSKKAPRHLISNH